MAKLESVSEIVRRAERNYLHGTVHMGKYVNFKMHEVIDTIEAYINSKHTSGPVDSLGREKPFFNIVTAVANIWMRATEIDRKDIRFVPKDSSSVVLAFVANVILQNWMDEARFGQFLKKWGRILSRYGSAVVEFVEKDDDLSAEVLPWNKLIVDPIQFDNVPLIKKLYLTPAQLRKNDLYDEEVVDALLQSLVTRKTLDKQHKDIQAEFIEVYEVHGELDSRLLEDDPEIDIPNKQVKYRQQMHAISMVQTMDMKTKTVQWEDFTLYKGKEKQSPNCITHLIEEDGRTLSIGAVEYLFDAQWMSNHTIKNMKDTLDISSKLIFQTADARFAGRNVLTAIESGDIFVWDKINGSEITMIQNQKPDITALQNYGALWQNIAKEITSTPDAMRGEEMPSQIAFNTVAAQIQQSENLFDVMTENKGLALEDMLKTYVIPYIKKKLKHKDEIVAMLDDAGVQEIDALYIPHEAVKRHNDDIFDKTIANSKTLIDHIQNKKPGLPVLSPIQPFDAQSAQAGVRQELGKFGNTRFFKPDDLDSKTWASLFSDFEWDNLRVQITNENSDSKAVLQTLSTVLQTIASNPAILQDPNARMVFNEILMETGKISPIQLTSAAGQPPPPQPQQNQQQQSQMPSNPPVPAGGGQGGLSALTQ